MEKSALFNGKNEKVIDYESEYKRLYEENVNLKIENNLNDTNNKMKNKTLKETVVKLAVKL